MHVEDERDAAERVESGRTGDGSPGLPALGDQAAAQLRGS